MNLSRPVLLIIIGTIGLMWLVWHIYSGWGLVTINVQDERADRVLGSIGRQGGIDIVSNLPPDTRVSLQVYRVSPLEALDIVAVRTDANWLVAYLGAPDRRTIDTALATFRSGANPENWTSFRPGGFGGGILSPTDAAIDLRKIEWTPEGDASLTDMLREASEKTGIYLAVPAEWSPQVRSPGAGTAEKNIPRIFQHAGGVAREVFLLRGNAPSENRTTSDGSSRPRREGWIGRPTTRGNVTPNSIANAENMAQRTRAQIALLPPDEQPAALEDLAMTEKFWGEVRELPEEQRRERAREFFTSPAMQERMEKRRAARENKMTPQQIIQRSQRYWDRKAAAKYQTGS